MSARRLLGGMGGIVAAFAVTVIFAGCIWLPGLQFPPPATPGPFGTPGVPSPVASGSPSEPVPSPAGVLSRDEAVATARQLATQFADGDLLGADLIRWSDVEEMGGETQGPPPGPDDLVWRVTLGYDHGPLDAAGEVLVLLASDGRLVQHSFWIA